MCSVTEFAIERGFSFTPSNMDCANSMSMSILTAQSFPLQQKNGAANREMSPKEWEQVIFRAAIWHAIAGNTKGTFILAEFHLAVRIPGFRAPVVDMLYVAYWGS